MKEYDLTPEWVSKLRRLDFEEVIEVGHDLIKSGDAKAGIECYKFANSTLDDTDFNKPVALFFIANGLKLVGNFKEAMEYCLKASNAIPKSMEKFSFNIEHPIKQKIVALKHHLENNQPVDKTKNITKPANDEAKEFTEDISDELVWKLANRGLVRMRLEDEDDLVYGYIKGRMRSMSNYSVQYEFTQLIDYDEEDPMEEEEYEYYFRYIDLEEIVAIKNLHAPTFQQLKFEKFKALMERIEEAFYGNFHFEISPQGNVLFLNSEYIESPLTAVNTINIMLKNNDDWNVFNSMNFDLVVLRGEQTYKLTNEQVHGIFKRR